MSKVERVIITCIIIIPWFCGNARCFASDVILPTLGETNYSPQTNR